MHENLRGPLRKASSNEIPLCGRAVCRTVLASMTEADLIEPEDDSQPEPRFRKAILCIETGNRKHASN